jgi:hypothetical protein
VAAAAAVVVAVVVVAVVVAVAVGVLGVVAWRSARGHALRRERRCSSLGS